MSLIAIRGLLRRHRRHRVLLAASVVLVAAIAAHHGSLSIGDVHHPMGAGAVVELCLGVFVAVGLGVVAVALGAIDVGRWRPVLVLAPGPPGATGIPAPHARDGPALLRLLCVRRC